DNLPLCLHDALPIYVAADDVGELAGGYVVVPASDFVVMRVEGVQPVLGQILRHDAFALVRPVDRKAVQRKADKRRMGFALVRERDRKSTRLNSSHQI